MQEPSFKIFMHVDESSAKAKGAKPWPTYIFNTINNFLDVNTKKNVVHCATTMHLMSKLIYFMTSIMLVLVGDRIGSPSKPIINSMRYLLVLDVNGLLCDAKHVKYLARWRPLIFIQRCDNKWVSPCPHVFEFLQHCSQVFNIGIYMVINNPLEFGSNGWISFSKSWRFQTNVSMGGMKNENIPTYAIH